ncbi:MAG: hypothetical protein EHM48_07520 [Planctomycetaceae bacterium]|nr:MAG: hypothetical protein EHM48_07520 [Planctomycetaceae bacterium]
MLEEIHRAKKVIVPIHVFGLTGYEDLLHRHAAEFRNRAWVMAWYRSDSDEWARQLTNLIVHIADSKSQRGAGYQCDVGIITALERVEAESVLKLEAGWKEVRVNDDDAIYYSGRFVRGEKSISAVLCACTEIGMPYAACQSMKLIENFRPRYLGMCGIAAGAVGVPGDILIAERAWDYGSGKIRQGSGGEQEFLPAPRQIALEPSLRARLGRFAMRDDVRYSIRKLWAGGNESGPPAVHIGSFASGAAVLEDSGLVGRIKAQDRKVIAIEMEAYSLFLASVVAKAPKPGAFCIKAVSDHGNSDKSDSYQAYAAFTSSRYLYEFCLDQLTESTLTT